MVNLIKANFYKIFRMKSFYICGCLGIAVAVLYLLSVNSQLGDLPPALFGYTGVKALMYGVTAGSLFCTIFISLFIPSEFSLGTIKNMISSGKSRLSIYFTKLIMGLFVVAAYTVMPALVAFSLGSFLWGPGELSRGDYLGLIRMVGLIILAEFAMQCLFIMVGFLVRRSGGTVAINLVSIMGTRVFVLPLIDSLVYKWLKIDTFSSEKYWPYTYSGEFLALNISQETLVTGLLVCAAAIIISSLIGALTFVKRDIK